MSYRTIALASCLLMVGCGGAPPPPADAPRAPNDSTAAAPHDALKGADQVDSAPKASGAAAAASASPSPSDPRGVPEGGNKKSGSVGQAVVESPEPLGGKLTQDDIRRILEKNGDVFGDCYTLGAGGKMKDFKGIVTVKATIGPSGAVNQVDVTKSTANNVKVDACVRDAFRKIKFPRPRDGATSVITFPISFNGIEQVQ
jgi:TonB family protein